jgi:hypothetical protein
VSCRTRREVVDRRGGRDEEGIEAVLKRAVGNRDRLSAEPSICRRSDVSPGPWRVIRCTRGENLGVNAAMVVLGVQWVQR